MAYREKCLNCVEKDEKIARLEARLSRGSLLDRFVGWITRSVGNEPVVLPEPVLPASSLPEPPQAIRPPRQDGEVWLDAAEKYFFIQMLGCTYVRKYDRTATSHFYVCEGWANQTLGRPVESQELANNLARKMVAYTKDAQARALLRQVKEAKLDYHR